MDIKIIAIASILPRWFRSEGKKLGMEQNIGKGDTTVLGKKKITEPDLTRQEGK